MNINPRSIYNKSEEFAQLIEQYDSQIICMSESWSRDNLTLDNLLKLDNYEIITNVQQRDFRGGKPAILVNTQNFLIKRICPDPITVPVGVEAVWCLVTPKRFSSKKFKYIAVCSLYYRGPKSTKKQELYDHIAEAFHFLSAKYGSHIQFIIAGDTNRLSLAPILSLSPRLQQAVKVPTRLNPAAILDPIITTLSQYYEAPVTKPPINPDVGKNGKPSDHLTVLMRPLSAAMSIKPRVYKIINYRPISESGIESFRLWIENYTWEDVYTCINANEKAQRFQGIVTENFQRCFPIKSLKICEDDQPWISEKLKKLDRQRKREYYKNKKSLKWEKLNDAFLELCRYEKEKYYTNIVEDLKTSNISQWYSKVKRMSGLKENSPDYLVDELVGLSDQSQAEIIASHYAAISEEYEPVSMSHFPEFSKTENITYPKISCNKVKKIIKSMNKKAAGVPGDIPMRLINVFSNEFSRPLAHLINSCFSQGIYPELWKMEYVTPVPKVYPPEKLGDLRKISGLMNFSKIADKIIAELISDDMTHSRDRAQYGNQKKVSIQHYLIKLLHKILTSLDSNSVKKSMAVVLQMIDWSQAFDRQSHIHGIQSFIDNGVRPSLIPILINFFQDRKMIVKWKGLLSSARSLPGGGPQGGTLGIEEYLSQSNGNVDHVDPDEKFKFIDDLSLLEIINLLSIGLSSYNCWNHVPSDISIDNHFVDQSNLKSQVYLNELSSWTNQKQMKLNTEKSKYMIFNFSKNYTFNTRLNIEGEILQQVQEVKLLGLVLREDLSWKSNTNSLIKRAYTRMIILRNLFKFNIPIGDLILIYTLYIRSVLEQSAVVWHSSLTRGEEIDIERVQKVALKIILNEQYSSYPEALKLTGLDSLKIRRKKLCLNFAKKCLKSDLTCDMFEENNLPFNTRNHEKFLVPFARTERFAKSAIPYMTKLLNQNDA